MKSQVTIASWIFLRWITFFHCESHAFSITGSVSTKPNTVLFRRMHQPLQSTPTPDSEENPDLDPSQLEWIQKRSEKAEAQARALDQERSEAEEEAAEKLAGNVNVPKTGISVNDEMTEMQNQERFLMKLFPLEKNGVAAIQTVTADSTSDEPMRYLVPLDDYANDGDGENASKADKAFAMIDVPCFSKDLAQQMKAFMGENGSLSHILVTCKNGIHYDETPAVYVTRKSDMEAWRKAFPSTKIIMYRLDVPRDCKSLVTQTLDGYGPWALDGGSGQFNETGRPLTVLEWDEDVQAKVLDDGEVPPDDDDEELDDADLYTPAAIKKREADKEILAIYTPGHTYGSVSYIFPKSRLCCSGFTIPVEDTRQGANAFGMPRGTGPKLDFSGYLTTNTGGIDRQIESARHLANVYHDRFDVVLPSRGPPVNLGSYSPEARNRLLHDMLDEFAELGRVYDSLGIL